MERGPFQDIDGITRVCGIKKILIFFFKVTHSEISPWTVVLHGGGIAFIIYHISQQASFPTAYIFAPIPNDLSSS